MIDQNGVRRVDTFDENLPGLRVIAMRKISLLEKKAAAFMDKVNKVENSYKNLNDKKKNYEIQTSINYIRLCLADKVPAPIDAY